MKARFPLGVKLSWLQVTTVFLIDVAILVLASRWPGDAQTATRIWWSGVAVAVLVAITALTTYHRIPLTTALALSVVGLFAKPERALTEGRALAVDHQRRYGRELVGVREHRNRLVTVIAVGSRSAAPPGRHHRDEATDVTLPVELVAGALRQFDVRLDSVDIVSVARRGAAAGETAADDAQPKPGCRETWLVLRMDPQRNAAAVAARDSLAATLAAATQRLAYDLDGRQITARVVTAEEFDDVDTAVLADLRPEETRIRLGRLKQKQGTGFVTSFWVSPQDITTENLEELWRLDVDATVITIRLTPRHRGVEVSALVRYHSTDPVYKKSRTALNRLTGRQLSAVRASLPVPTRQPALTVPARQLHDHEQLAISSDPVEERRAVRVGALP